MLIPKSNYTEMQKPLLPALAQTAQSGGGQQKDAGVPSSQATN